MPLPEVLKNIKTLDSPSNDEMVCRNCGSSIGVSGQTEGLCSLAAGSCYSRYGIGANVPRQFRGWIFGAEHYELNSRNAAANKAAAEFLSSDHSLYLFGPAGHGKTYLLVASFIRALQQFERARYVNVPEILLVTRESYETREEAELRTIRGLLNYHLLYLDDMAAENITGRTREMLYLILNKSIEEGSPRLFITGNKGLKFIAEQVDDRLASRIAGLCTRTGIIKLEDKDRRL